MKGFYWSSILHEKYELGAYGLQFDSEGWNWDKTCQTYLGNPVRAVSLTKETCWTNGIQALSYSELPNSAPTLTTSN